MVSRALEPPLRSAAANSRAGNDRWTTSWPCPYRTAGTRPARRVRRALPLPNSVRVSASRRKSATVMCSSTGGSGPRPAHERGTPRGQTHVDHGEAVGPSPSPGYAAKGTRTPPTTLRRGSVCADEQIRDGGFLPVSAHRAPSHEAPSDPAPTCPGGVRAPAVVQKPESGRTTPGARNYREDAPWDAVQAATFPSRTARGHPGQRQGRPRCYEAPPKRLGAEPSSKTSLMARASSGAIDSTVSLSKWRSGSMGSVLVTMTSLTLLFLSRST